ncbi:hypothetical protein FHS96_005589 [Sphingomonas zeicaulis]
MTHEINIGRFGIDRQVLSESIHALVVSRFGTRLCFLYQDWHNIIQIVANIPGDGAPAALLMKPRTQPTV